MQVVWLSVADNDQQPTTRSRSRTFFATRTPDLSFLFLFFFLLIMTFSRSESMTSSYFTPRQGLVPESTAVTYWCIRCKHSSDNHSRPYITCHTTTCSFQLKT